jgi:hypothetical protein
VCRLAAACVLHNSRESARQFENVIFFPQLYSPIGINSAPMPTDFLPFHRSDSLRGQISTLLIPFVISRRTHGLSLRVLLETLVRFRELVPISGNPHVQRRQQEDAEEQRGEEATHDNNGKRPLGVRPDAAR